MIIGEKFSLDHHPFVYPRPKPCAFNCFWVYNCTKNETFKEFGIYLPSQLEPEQNCWLGKFGNEDYENRKEHLKKAISEKLCRECWDNSTKGL